MNKSVLFWFLSVVFISTSITVMANDNDSLSGIWKGKYEGENATFIFVDDWIVFLGISYTIDYTGKRADEQADGQVFKYIHTKNKIIFNPANTDESMLWTYTKIGNSLYIKTNDSDNIILEKINIRMHSFDGTWEGVENETGTLLFFTFIDTICIYSEYSKDNKTEMTRSLREYDYTNNKIIFTDIISGEYFIHDNINHIMHDDLVILNYSFVANDIILFSKEGKDIFTLKKQR